MSPRITACIHQPNYLPWLGFFAKIVQSDVFIVMDNVQFPKQTYVNRVKVAGNGPPLWLTVPVVRSGLDSVIKDVLIDHKHNWIHKHVQTLRQRYGKYPYYNELMPVIQSCLESSPTTIAELNVQLITILLNVLEIDTKLVHGSSLGCDGKASQLITRMCKCIGAETYLAGGAALDAYEDLSEYDAAGIEYRQFNFTHPTYRQVASGGVFTPGLSVVDAICAVGLQETRSFLGSK
jgi:hypothetical protein